jgi:hypothetical protein
MNFPSRLGAIALFVSCMAAAPVFAQTPAPAPAPAPSAVDPAKKAEIMKLLQVSGAAKMVEQMKQQMFTLFRQQASSLPPEFWTRLDKDMDTQELLNKLIPVYDKYYSLDDLKAANAFYQSPAGQHILMAQPQIMKDSMDIGKEWGQEAGMKVMEEMRNYKSQSTGTSTAPATPPATP